MSEVSDARDVGGSNKRKDPPSPSMSDEEESVCVRPDWRMDPEESHSDWTIELLTGGKLHATYHVHKLFLSVGSRRSYYFSRLFGSKDFAESQTGTSRIEMEELAAKAFPVTLDYTYFLWNAADNEAPITHENSVALHYLGRYFGMHSLRKTVRTFWKKNMTAEQLGMYYEHAKLFRDDKAYQAVVEKCCKSVESVKVDSHLMQVSDAQFWLDILEQSEGQPSPALSTIITTFCSNNEEHLDAVAFLKLTGASVLPSIAGSSALRLLELERKIVPADDSSLTELSSLQERCVETLASAWRKTDYSKPNHSLSVLSPRVYMSVMVRSLDKAREQLETAEKCLKLPNVVVSGAGSNAVNGVYKPKLQLHNESFRFSKPGFFEGESVTFEICSLGTHWSISIWSYRDTGDATFYSTARSRDSNAGILLPPTTGWVCQEEDEGEGNAPTLYIQF